MSATVGMRVIRNEGVLALMKGSGVFSLKRVGDWVTRYYFATEAERFLFGGGVGGGGGAPKKLTVGQEMTASMIGGFLSTLVTIPMDVVVAQIQQQSNAGQKVGVVALFRKQYAQGGLKQMTGFATKVRACASVCWFACWFRWGLRLERL